MGPGSQAPRADETLVGKLYELETACLGIDSLEAPPDRSFFDRLFRNLMTDSGGNTHRAELCVDKLWNFDSPTGLQGLIELRAFETMPEVGHQSIAALFVRAILAMLADRPCTEPLIRWGATLHDAYMLPTLLLQDLRAICKDLLTAGLDFDIGWLLPLLEQRFPVLGRFAFDGGEVLVRQALEPWPLMAEIADGGTTSRVVDNSTDRIEVSVSNPEAFGKRRVVVEGIALAMREVSGRSSGVCATSRRAAGLPFTHTFQCSRLWRSSSSTARIASSRRVDTTTGTPTLLAMTARLPIATRLGDVDSRGGGRRMTAWAPSAFLASQPMRPKATTRSTFAGKRSLIELAD